MRPTETVASDSRFVSVGRCFSLSTYLPSGFLHLLSLPELEKEQAVTVEEELQVRRGC